MTHHRFGTATRSLRSRRGRRRRVAMAVERSPQATPPTTPTFYAIAGEMVDTLHALDDLAGGARPAGRRLRQRPSPRRRPAGHDPAERLAAACTGLRSCGPTSPTPSASANRFWSAIGHIGVEVAP